MLRRSQVVHLLFVSAFTLTLAWCEWDSFGPLRHVDAALEDWLARIGRKEPADPRLVFLARDTASANLETAGDLEQFGLSEAEPEAVRALELMAREWPWSREVHGLVLDRLVAAGAHAVVFDLTFPKPSPNDEPLRLALGRHRERVVVAGNIAEDDRLALEQGLPVFDAPAPTLIPETTPRDSRIGYDNFGPDADGVIRSAHFRWAFQHGVWEEPEEFSLAARALQRAGLAERIPADRLGRRFRYAGPPATFTPRSIYEIFVPAYWRQNYGGGKFFEGKIVVIGGAGNWQHDEHATPHGLMPGPEIHLNAINAALHGAFLREVPPAGRALFVFAAAGAALLLRWRVRQQMAWFAAQGLVTAVWAGAALALFNRADLLIPCVAPLLAFHLNGVTSLVFDVLTARREKGQLRSTLERYVSRDVVEELVDRPEEFREALGGELRAVTVLFSDIRDFTRKARTMRSPELVAQLNEYFSAMVECVFANGGTLDKFIGDAVMAVWGSARRSDPGEDARRAVACAHAMRLALDRLNTEWAAAGRPQFRIGIAINSGEVVVGNIGSPRRMEFTVIGDAVNIAWRIQERTKEFGDAVLVGEAVLPLLGDAFATEPCGEYLPPDSGPVAFARVLATPEAAVVAAA